LIDQATNVVWRLDIWAQQAVRDTSWQASPLLHQAASAANWWGGTGVGALLWFGGRALKRSTAARIGLRGVESLALASAISGITKGLAGRARPFVTPGEPWHWEFNHGWSDAHFFSMPSGHVTSTTAFAVGVLLATRQWPAKTRLFFAGPLLLSAATVALARMYSNQHWLTDIVVAALLGSAVAIAVARVHAAAQRAGYERVMLGNITARDPA